MNRPMWRLTRRGQNVIVGLILLAMIIAAALGWPDYCYTFEAWDDPRCI